MMEVLEAKEAAVYLRMPYSTFCQKCARGEVPHAKIGKRRLFNVVTLDQWFKEQELKSISKRHENDM